MYIQGCRSASPSLDDCGQPLTATDTHGHQAVAALCPLELTSDGAHHPRACGSDGVPQRYPGAVDVGPGQVVAPQVPGTHHRDGLSRECFIEFDDIDVLE